MFRVPEQYRLRTGQMGTSSADGNNGYFLIPTKEHPGILRVIATDGAGWEHVSVSTESRCPFWHEMTLIKKLFWDADDLVVQFHPPEKEYVNCHPYCLHLWRSAGTNDFTLRPPPALVGPLAR